MEKYALYFDEEFIATFSDYLLAKEFAKSYRWMFAIVDIVDMMNGVLCYRWVC